MVDIFKHDLVAGSFIPPLDIRQLRDLMRYLTKLTNCNTGEKNCAQNCLTVSNIELASVVPDVFGKSASAITDHWLSYPDDKDFDFRPLLQKALKKKADDIALAIDGNITFERGEKMKIILAHMESIETCKTNLVFVILGAVVKSDKYPEIRNRYLPIKKRRGHKRAIIAIARRLLTAIYQILKKSEPYNAELYRKSDIVPLSRDISPEQAIFIVQRQGYQVSEGPAAG